MVFGIGAATWLGRAVATQQDPETAARAVMVQYLRDGYSAVVTPSRVRGAQATIRDQITATETISDPEKPSVFRSTISYRENRQCPEILSSFVACSYDSFNATQQAAIDSYFERERRSAEVFVGDAVGRAVNCTIERSAGKLSGLICELAPVPRTHVTVPFEQPRMPKF